MLRLVFLSALLGLSIGAAVTDDDIKTVHMVFMNHLDVGYSLKSAPGHIMAILNTYFHEYFPRAIQIATELNVLGYRERFIYTTHPYLVSMYLDCPPNLVLSGIKLQCPDKDNVTAFEAAVQAGVITWHAGPMNMEFEMLDESMMEFAIQLSIDLDKRFGFERQYRTVSQRDVPGTTKAIIPILKKLGVAALSIGVNGATTPAAVPPVFLWKNGNDSLITLYHPGGYPNGYGPTPMVPGGLSRKDCALVDGFDHALCFAFRSDNTGPPKDYNEVLTTYEIARGQFPNAYIEAATFENYTSLLASHVDKLPVLTKEMGDVWIQGGGSDPRKTAEMRAMFRARAECLKSGQCSMSDKKIYNATRFMLKHGEHTWGAAGNSVDNMHWTNDEFHKLNTPGSRFDNATLFWDEQRNFTGLVMEALGDHPLAQIIQEEFKQFQPQEPDVGDMHRQQNNAIMGCGDFKMRFDTQGALVQLTDGNGKDWASEKYPMGQFVYHTYNERDFDLFFNATLPNSKFFFLGIGKPNMSKNAAPDSKYWNTKLNSVFTDSKSSKVVVLISMQDPVTLDYYGAPETVTVEFSCAKSSINLNVQWFNKVATRLPEDLNFVFTPVPQPGLQWYLNKIDQLIDPLDVVANGSQHHHAINRGVYYVNNKMQGLEILSLDSALATVLTEGEFVNEIPYPLPSISNVTGMAFNMYNNVWETNYIFWYPYTKKDINQKFRFTLNFM